MEFIIPDYVNEILNRLENAGFEAYIVGGSVRDLFLGKAPSDYDITTSATPEEIQEVFSDFKTIDVGKRFGTIVVVHPKGHLEVTTFRSEGEYTDGRRPDKISFSKDIYEDLSRRDFTINAIAYNNIRGIVDPFNGRGDIEKGIIRSVGNPNARFKEDYLRILRAVRLASQLNFKLDDQTYVACLYLSNSLEYISAERIRDELFKVLLSSVPSKGILLMKQLDILDVILPELLDTVALDQQNPNHIMELFDHILCVLDKTPPILTLRMAALLHDIGKPRTFTIDEGGVGHFYGHDRLGAEMSKMILTRLNCSKVFIDKVAKLISEHMHHSNMKEKGLKRQLMRVGEENIFELAELKKADMRCKDESKDISIIDKRADRIREILKNKEPFDKNHLNINGNDIISLGFPRGQIIGEILDYLLEKVLEHPEYNTKEKLIELVKNKVDSE